jgi:hypothetical protein
MIYIFINIKYKVQDYDFYVTITGGNLTIFQIRLQTLMKLVGQAKYHSFVEWLDTFSYVLRPAYVTVKEVNDIRCFAIDIAKYLILLSCRGYNDKVIESGFSKASEINRNDLLEYKEKKINKRVPLVLTYHPSIRCFAIDITKYLILLSCRLAMEHLCVLQLEAALATLVTTWYTLADSRSSLTHVCGSQYVGESVQPFNKRMNGHRSDLAKKTLLHVSQHFVSPGDQALVNKLKNKRFRPFCLCLPGVMFVTRGSKNSLFSVFDFLSNLDCGQ